MAHPSLDQRLAAFAGLPLGHLRGHTMASEPVVEVSGAQADAEMLADERGQSWRRPAIRGVPEIAGAAIQPGKYLPDLLYIEFGWPTGPRSGE